MAVESLDAPLTADHFSYNPGELSAPPPMPAVEIPTRLFSLVGHAWLPRLAVERIIQTELDSETDFGRDLAHELIETLDSVDSDADAEEDDWGERDFGTAPSLVYGVDQRDAWSPFDDRALD